MKESGNQSLISFLKRNVFIIIIFLIALLVRSYKLGTLPGGFYEEEMTNAYVGKFILLNGKDLYGNILPLAYFDKFNDYPPVLPMYLSGFTAFIFGNNEFGSRFATALIGALTVFPVYLLLCYLLKHKQSALFGSFLISILPWHVVLSRTSAEGIIGLFTYIFSILLLLHALEKPDIKKIISVACLLFLSYFIYPSLRILIPLSLIPLPFLIPKINISFRKYFICLLLIFSLLTAGIATTNWGKARFEQTSLFGNNQTAEMIARNNESLHNQEGINNIFMARFFHNKVTGYTREFIRQYLNYFSSLYLFYEAGGQYRYYNVMDQGLLYIFMIPLLLFSVISVNKKINPKYILYMIFLLTAAPVPAALTVDFTPHAHRSVFMILPLVFLAAYGFSNLYLTLKKPTILSVIFVIIAGIEFAYFWHAYSVHADSNQSVLRNGGDKEMIRYTIQNADSYEKIIIPAFERLPLYYLYFTGTYDRNLIGKFRSGLQADGYRKVVFYNDWCPTLYIKSGSVPLNTLIADSAICDSPSGYKKILTITRRDATAAYYLYEPRP